MIASTKSSFPTANLIGIFIVILFSSLLPADAAPRKFTNSAGKVIEAELVSATASTATLKMGNGKEITAKSSLFSSEDQKFIADWLEKHPAQISYRFEIDQSRTKKGKSETRSGNTNVHHEDLAYKISVKNLCKDGKTNVAIKNLKVSYKIYKSSNANSVRRSSGGSSATVAGKYFVTSGSKTIADLAYLKNAEVETLPVTISTSQLDGNFYYSDGGKSKKKDKLEGLWVKLFHDGKVVGEYKSSGGALKSAVWK